MQRAYTVAIATSLLTAVTSCGVSTAKPNASNQRTDEPLHQGNTASAQSNAKSLPTLSTTTERTIPVRYRRAYLGEVLYDLHRRVGLEAAFPRSLDGGFTFDLVAERISVEQLLKRLATAGNLELEFRGRVAVFWKRADVAQLHALEELIKDRQARGRCRALEELAQLGDPRIYPIMFWAMAKGSEPMALAAARLLDRYHADTLRYGKDFELLANGLQRLLPTRPADERDRLISLAGASRSPRCGHLLLPWLEERRHGSHAVFCMGQTRDARTVKPLLEFLKEAPPPDPYADTGYSAVDCYQIIRTLGQIGSMEAIHALREMAKEERDQHRLMELSGALFEAGDQRGYEILLKLLAETAPGASNKASGNAASPAGGGSGAPVFGPLRARIARALARVHDERALEPLIGVLKDPRVAVRIYAARILGETRDPRAVAPLLELLADEELRVTAVDALGRIGDPRAIEPMAKLLDDRNPEVRYQAAVYLFHAGDPRGRRALKSTPEDWDQQYRDRAVVALALAGDPDGVQALVAQLKPEESRRPRDAADTLAKVRDVNTIRPLVEALKNKDPNASIGAANAIAEMRDPRASEQAIALLTHEDAAMRVWGAWILGWTKDPAGSDALIDALADEDANVRTYAARALISIGDRRSRHAALAMLKDPDRNVRRYTADALGKVRDQKVIDALFAALKAQDFYRGQPIAKALLATHDPAAIKRLALLANASSSSGQSKAAARAFRHATGYKAEPCVMDELIIMMRDEDPQVRASAAAALGPMLDPCAIEPLITALEDTNANVRQTARRMLRKYPDEPRAKETLKR